MAFPFAFVPGFRQQLILAIGTTSLASAAALGCDSQRRADEQAPGQQMQPGGSNAAPTAGKPPVLAGTGGKAQTGGSGTTDVPMQGVSGMAGMSMMAGSGIGGISMIAGSGAAGMSMTGASGMGEAGMSGASGASWAGQAGTSASLCMTFASERECFARASMEAQAKYGCGMIANPPARFTDAEVQQHFLPNGCLERALSCNGCCNPAVSEGEPQADGSCCYMFCAGSCCGRPLIVEGQARLAGLERRSDWLQAFAGSAIWDARIASEWLEDARMEHASIASFARFTLDLLQFGAPSLLVELAQRAGLDEIEHARKCFGLAARYGACESGPGPLLAADVRVSASLFHAACAAFEEGCIGETLAALQARAALELATDVEVRHTLAQIAEQEAAHAELAWRFVSWAVARLGPQLARELRGRFAQRMLTSEPVPEREPAEAVAALHAAGRLTSADKHRVTVFAMRDVVAACVSELERVNAERHTGEACALGA